MSRAHRIRVAGLAAIALAGAAHAKPASDAQYIAKSMTAAPAGVAKGATVVAMGNNGAMRTVRKGGNGWTCMLMPDKAPMCADAGGMGWLDALLQHSPPPNKAGFMYMLAGDHGVSNVSFEARDHWVTTGPHVMILGAAAKAMAGYPRTLDPDTSKPYVMWPGTPYEHLMVPVR
jgi:hypothetical protein